MSCKVIQKFNYPRGTKVCLFYVFIKRDVDLYYAVRTKLRVKRDSTYLHLRNVTFV